MKWLSKLRVKTIKPDNKIYKYKCETLLLVCVISGFKNCVQESIVWMIFVLFRVFTISVERVDSFQNFSVCIRSSKGEFSVDHYSFYTLQTSLL